MNTAFCQKDGIQSEGIHNKFHYSYPPPPSRSPQIGFRSTYLRHLWEVSQAMSSDDDDDDDDDDNNNNNRHPQLSPLSSSAAPSR